MPVFYKGAGPGTYWAGKDARTTGFTPHSAGIKPTKDRLVHHIVNGSTFSPYLSFTRSWGVAWDYAMHAGRSTALATQAQPGFVYEIELEDPLPLGFQLLDPLVFLGPLLPAPTGPQTYHHDGLPSTLCELVKPGSSGSPLSALRLSPPPGGNGRTTPNISDELTLFVRVLRDAEVVGVGNLPSGCVVQRHTVP